jgi:hypothetical protein
MADRLAEIERSMANPAFIISESRVYESLEWLIAEVKDLRRDLERKEKYLDDLIKVNLEIHSREEHLLQQLSRAATENALLRRGKSHGCVDWPQGTLGKEPPARGRPVLEDGPCSRTARA